MTQHDNEQAYRSELKACPWCHELPRIDYEPHPGPYETRYTISCRNNDCPMSELRLFADSLPEGVKDWNSYNRKPEEPVYEPIVRKKYMYDFDL